MTNAAIKQLIAQGVVDALGKIKANRTSRNGDNSHDSGTGSRRTERAVRECTYSEFLKCQPLNFKGSEGVVSLTQWFKKMEYVFHISNCIVACQIKFATCTLFESALSGIPTSRLEPSPAMNVGIKGTTELIVRSWNHGNQAGGVEARGMVYALGERETGQDIDDMEDDINA
ncbi:hypothetical protein Tco_0746899 [Tanacetum coccineum]